VKFTRGLFLAVITSAVLALMLSFLPTVEMGNLKLDQGVSVLKLIEHPLTLNMDNVPDVILNKSYHQKVHRIEWQNSILTVDFIVELKDARKSWLYQDLWKMAFLGLKNTTNVKEVHTRVYIETGENRSELAVAMVAKRKMLPASVDWEEDKTESIRIQLESMFDITYKSKWMDIP
jgi:hypothetical protein